jgi:multicomponent Na+:H+ antiporter subunit G
MIDYAAYTLITLGILLDLFGTVALIRLPDVYNRLSSAIKCAVAGTALILLGIVVLKGFSSAGIKALLCIAVLLVTVPAMASALARSARIAGVRLSGKSVCDQYADEKKLTGKGIE